MYCYIYLLIVPHKTTFVLEETVLECASSGESFSTAPRDSAFSRKKKKRGKIFTLFLFKHAKDAFLRIKIHQKLTLFTI